MKNNRKLALAELSIKSFVPDASKVVAGLRAVDRLPASPLCMYSDTGNCIEP